MKKTLNLGISDEDITFSKCGLLSTEYTVKKKYEIFFDIIESGLTVGANLLLEVEFIIVANPIHIL